jgi:hypothetical protein
MKKLLILALLAATILPACRNRAREDVVSSPSTTKEDTRNVWELDRHTHDSLMMSTNTAPDTNYNKK